MYRQIAVAAIGALVLAASNLPAAAEETSALVRACSEEWQAAKAAGKVALGEMWPKFLSDCRARHASDAEPAPAAAAAAVPAPITAASADPASAPAPAVASAASATATPATATPAAGPSVMAQATPSQSTPPSAPSAAPTNPPAPSGKTRATSNSGGRAAMVSRERQCAARWHQVKGTSNLPAGVTSWPKYWSWCNKQLKNGQSI
jgi:hypothetical protein